METQTAVVETLRAGDGFPLHTVRVTAAEDVWRRSNGRPGFVAFEVFDAITESGGELLYETPGSTNPMENMTSDLDAALAVACGTVKWDGCVDYLIGEQQDEPCMLHGCSVRDVRALADAVVRAYEIAAEMVGVDED